MSESDLVLRDLRDGVLTLTLNRPDRNNAFTVPLEHAYYDALEEAAADEAVRVIVLTGAGRSFCPGLDVQVLAEGIKAGKLESEKPRRKPSYPLSIPKPIIAAINGAAVGLGLTYPMLWDIRVAAEDAKLGFVFNRRGFLPEGNSLWLLSRLVGASCALELLLTGRMFDGREAAELKLVSRAVPTDQVLPAAQQIARDIAENTAPVSTAITKRLFYSFLESSDRLGARAEELDYVRWAMEQPDFREGMSAFLEKRTPQWTGTDLPAGLR